MNVKRILAWITCIVLVFGSIGFNQMALAQDLESTVEPTATLTPEPTATLVPGSTATFAPGSTATPAPGSIVTPAPGSTTTPAPDSIATPTPEPTATPTLPSDPTATPTAAPTGTILPTPPGVTPTPTVHPDLPTASPGNITTPTTPASNQPICTLTLNKTEVNVGDTITANWTLSGGVEPYDIYGVIWELTEANGNIIGKDINGVTSFHTFKVLAGTSGSCRIWGVDALGRDILCESKGFTVIGASPPPAPPVIRIDLHSGSVKVGDTISADIITNGGMSPCEYRVTWIITEASGGEITWDEQGADIFFVSYRPMAGQSGRLSVSLYDAAGRYTWTESDPFEIIGAVTAEPLALEVNLPKGTVDAKDTITADLLPSGGTPPYSYEMTWVITGLYGEEVEFTQEGTELTSATLITPANGRSGFLRVFLRDAAGRLAYGESGEFQIDPYYFHVFLDKTSVAVGEKVTATWELSELYKQDYSVNGYSLYWFIMEENGPGFTVFDYTTEMSASFVPRVGDSVALQVWAVNSSPNGDNALKEINSNRIAITGSLPVEPFTCTFKLSDTSVNVGSEISAEWTLGGGTPPYTVTDAVWGIVESEGVGVNPTIWFNDTSLVSPSKYTALAGISGRFNLMAYDAAGRWNEFQSDPFDILGGVLVDPLRFSVSLRSSSVHVGETITAEFTTTGGTSPYSYTYNWYVTEANGEVLVKSESVTGVTSASYTPMLGVRGQLMDIAVRDVVGRVWLDQSEEFTITGAPVPPPPITCTINLDSAATLGETFTAIWETLGGTAPYTYTCVWVITEEDGTLGIIHMNDLTGSSASFNTVSGQEGYLQVRILDAIGRIRVFTSDTFTITAAPAATPTPEPTATPTPEPTAAPTPEPTATPTPEPTATPTPEHTATPTPEPTAIPTPEPTTTPTPEPTAIPTPVPTATPTLEPTATPTVKPTVKPTAAPTATPTFAPSATPTIMPTLTPEPTSAPTISAQAAASLVYDEEEGSVPFTLSSASNEAGASELTITAQAPTPAPSTGDGPAPTNTVVNWSFNQALIDEVESADYSSVKTCFKDISVIIPVEELKNFTGTSYVVTIEEVKTETLSATARTAVESMTKQSEVYTISIVGKAPDELILVSFAIPESVDANDYQIVEVNAEDGTVNYPAASLVVAADRTYIQGNVRNGSICFLTMK